MSLFYQIRDAELVVRLPAALEQAPLELGDEPGETRVGDVRQF